MGGLPSFLFACPPQIPQPHPAAQTKLTPAAVRCAAELAAAELWQLGQVVLEIYMKLPIILTCEAPEGAETRELTLLLRALLRIEKPSLDIEQFLAVVEANYCVYTVFASLQNGRY